MKCCGCGKEIDLNQILNSKQEPLYFEKCRHQQIIKVICSECMKDVQKKTEYVEKD
jgi:hypothetical protein